MKVEKADYIWAVLTFITVGVTYSFGVILYGILMIYGMLTALLVYHIMQVKKRLANTVAVYGRITEIRIKKEAFTYYYPIVEYETEEGRQISTMYTYPDKKNRYEEGDEELICYDPDDPVFFYFANREKELTDPYYKYILFSSVPALVVFCAVIAK